LYYLLNKEKKINRERKEEKRGERKKRGVDIEWGQGVTQAVMSVVTAAIEKMRAQR